METSHKSAGDGIAPGSAKQTGQQTATACVVKHHAGLSPLSAVRAAAEKSPIVETLLLERCHQALAVALDMTVAIEAICIAGQTSGSLQRDGLFDAILACLEKQSNVVLPALDSFTAAAVCHA